MQIQQKTCTLDIKIEKLQKRIEREAKIEEEKRIGKGESWEKMVR